MALFVFSLFKNLFSLNLQFFVFTILEIVVNYFFCSIPFLSGALVYIRVLILFQAHPPTSRLSPILRSVVRFMYIAMFYLAINHIGK